MLVRRDRGPAGRRGPRSGRPAWPPARRARGPRRRESNSDGCGPDRAGAPGRRWPAVRAAGPPRPPGTPARRPRPPGPAAALGQGHVVTALHPDAGPQQRRVELGRRRPDPADVTGSLAVPDRAARSGTGASGRRAGRRAARPALPPARRRRRPGGERAQQARPPWARVPQQPARYRFCGTGLTVRRPGPAGRPRPGRGHPAARPEPASVAARAWPGAAASRAAMSRPDEHQQPAGRRDHRGTKPPGNAAAPVRRPGLPWPGRCGHPAEAGCRGTRCRAYYRAVSVTAA